MYEFEEVFRIVSDEDSDLLNVGWDVANDGANRFWHHVTGTLFVEDKSERVRAGFDGGLCVLEICDSANFYPGHQAPIIDCHLFPDQDVRLALRFRQQAFQGFSRRLCLHQ